MIIFRYLSKEILTTLTALTTILLLIFLSNQFVRYLARAAGGQMPGLVVFKLMLLEIPNILGLLLPLGMYMAILLAYGRLYAESEMTVLEACGFSQKKLLMMTMVIASVVAVIVAVFVMWISPNVQRDRDYLLTSVGASAFLETLNPGRFRSMPGGNRIIYIEDMSKDKAYYENIFVAQRARVEQEHADNWDVLLAKKGYVEEDKQTGIEYAVFEQGSQYIGIPGKAGFQIVQFDKYKARLPVAKPRVRYVEYVLPMSELWPPNNTDRLKAAEFQWRISIPLMTLLLALLAVPLSRVNPRQGKYARIFPAILIYLAYANLLFVARGWIANGKLPVAIGMWWLHGLVLLLAVILLWRMNRRNKSKQVAL